MNWVKFTMMFLRLIIKLGLCGIAGYGVAGCAKPEPTVPADIAARHAAFDKAQSESLPQAVTLLPTGKDEASKNNTEAAPTDHASTNLPATNPASSDLKPSNNDAQAAVQAKSKGEYAVIDWLELIPDDDLYALENPPAYLDDIVDGSVDDTLQSQLKAQAAPADDRYQQALTSTQIRPEFNGRKVRIPGFIVPLEFDDQQTITTFFFVPFFGACIHLPPPPPNQIIYAEYERGIKLEALYAPFWVEGTLSTTLIENDMATAAYAITVDDIGPYEE